jgi:hypothetical protein
MAAALVCLLSSRAVAQQEIAVSMAQLRATTELRQSMALDLPEQPQVQPAARVAPRHSSRRTGEILMIVGGAGIVTGLLVDEDIVTIAGAAVGGYGLYLYLR